MVIYTLLIIAGTYAVTTKGLPPLFNSDGTYSNLRIILEVILNIMFMISLVHLFLKKHLFEKSVFIFVVVSILLTIASEIIITLNTSGTHHVSVFGLDLKLLAYFLFFQITLVFGIAKPQEIFYRNLQSNWEQLQDLINNLNEGICIIDSNGKFQFSNPAAEKIFGVKQGKLTNHRMTDFIVSDSLDAYREHKKNIEGKKTSIYELEIKNSQEEIRSLIITASPQIIDGKLAGEFSIIHDNTVRKKEIDKVNEARRFYQTLFMDAPIRIWELNYSPVYREIQKLAKKGIENFSEYFMSHPEEVKRMASIAQIKSYNKLAEKVYLENSSRERINSLTDIFSEESYQPFIAEIMAIAKGQTTLNHEMITKADSGNMRYSIINWAVLPGFENDYSRVIISAEDITDRKKAQVSLLESVEKFRLLAENANIGISYYDTEGYVIYQNEKTKEYNGRTDFDDTGKNLIEIYGEELGNIVLERIQKTAAAKTTLIFEHRHLVGDSEKWFSVQYTPILNQQGNCNGVQTISQDITDQKELEKELQSLARVPQENPNPVMRLTKDGEGDLFQPGFSDHSGKMEL